MMPVLAGAAVVRVSLAPVDLRLGLDGLSLRAPAVAGASVFSAFHSAMACRFAGKPLPVCPCPYRCRGRLQ